MMAGPMQSAPAMVRTATGIGLVALAIGLLAQLLFIDAGVGINVPIATRRTAPCRLGRT